MNRFIFLTSFFFVSFFSFSQQNYFQFWLETGVKGKIKKNIEYAVDWNNRFGNYNLQTTFGQASIKYKIKKWLKPSVDYRYISDRQDNSNYSSNHRLNFNLQFSKTKKRLDLGLRLRYQYSFSQLFVGTYEPEFDESLRIKPSISYDINNFPLTPQISTELFYDPSNYELGNRFTKIRYSALFSLDLKGPHNIEFGYIFDQRIQLETPLNRHILNLNYTFQIKKN
jgi:hypothetical protein